MLRSIDVPWKMWCIVHYDDYLLCESSYNGFLLEWWSCFCNYCYSGSLCSYESFYHLYHDHDLVAVELASETEKDIDSDGRLVVDSGETD